MAARRRIALLVGQPEEKYQQQFLGGFLETIFTHDYDVCIFAMDQKQQRSAARGSGESNIFSLIQCEMFDSFVVLSDTLRTPGVVTELKGKLKKEFSGPVIYADSAPDSAVAYGKYTAKSVYAMSRGETVPEWAEEENDGTDWETEQEVIDKSEGSYYSHTNLIMQDLMLQDTFEGIIGTVFSYVHQIRPFDSFHLCLNDWWVEPGQLMLPEGGRRTFSNQMLRVLQCGPDGENQDKIDFEDVFDTEKMLPDLFYDRAQPKAYIFTPLHFEEHCFGYAVLSYGNQPKCYGEVYRLWLRSVTQGMECFRRVEALKQNSQVMSTRILRDELTGFYNYNGLLEQAETILNQAKEQDYFITAMAVDISGLSEINDNFGREEGNRVIVTIARLVESCAEDGITCCLGNGEFLLVEYTEEKSHNKIQAVRNRILNLLEQHNMMEGNPYAISIHTGNSTERVLDKDAFEQMINAAVSRKNGNKVAELRLRRHEELTPKEVEEAKLVKEILDENLLCYYFQPIVNAKTGEIYAFEALMRSQTETAVSPLMILKYAEHLGRLYDVEKATFFNVLQYIEDNEALFGGKKVFINSIPGSSLEGEDKNALRIQMNKHSGMIVVELTEQAELNDEELSVMKEEYAQSDIQTAVDDYGTGYSNVTNLLRYMPNYVKIDRLLLNEIHNSPQKQHFVREIIEFAHDNDIMTLAEGVETTEELKAVIDLGVDLVQGFYTAKPMPQPVRDIDMGIKEEILKYNRADEIRKKSRIYFAGRERRVPLVNLVARKYFSIFVENEETTYKDISLMGVPGFQAKMDLKIADGFTGRIVLNHVILLGKKNRPAIELGENCDVTLVLEGDNELLTGGIRVPESAKLTLQGNGNLFIHGNNVGGYGIGNTAETGHGIISLEQDGCLDIRLEGNKLVGIGSGHGGEIHIHRGKYIIRLKGKESVAVGSIYAECNMTANEFDMECYIISHAGVCLGSLEGNTEIHVKNALARYSLSGKQLVGIGSVSGKQNKAFVEYANFSIDLRGDKVCGIGSIDGTGDCDLMCIALTVHGKGEHALTLGCMNQSGNIRMENCDVNAAITSEHEEDFGAVKGAIEIIEGRSHFEHNGEIRTFTTEG